MKESETIKTLVTDAMFKTLDQAKRDELIRAALASILKEDFSRLHGHTDSPLSQAFQDAANQVCREIVREKLEKDPEFVKQIRGVIDDAFENVLKKQRPKLVQSVTDALLEGFKFKERY